MYLTKNVLIESIEDGKVRTERVLYMSSEIDAIVLIKIKDEGRTQPTWLELSKVRAELDGGNSRLLRHDPWLALPRSEEELTKAEQDGRERAWNIIEPIVQAGTDMYDRRARGRLVTEVLNRGFATKPTIYTLLYRYWKGGQTIHTLIPHYEKSGAHGQKRTTDVDHVKRRGRPTLIQKNTGEVVGVNVDEPIRKLLVKIGEEFYENRGSLTEKQAFEEGLRTYFHDGYDVLPNGTRVPILLPDKQLPTLTQFKYWYGKAKDPDAVTRKRDGERAYNLKRRGFRGDSSAIANRPGAVYQVDATVGDVYLVSSRDPRLIIGRPVIYVVVDTFSRLVVGFTVGLEGPSWMGAVLSFENVAMDKVAFCHSLGITITQDVWPVEHFPEAVLGDGGELKSTYSDDLVKGFNVNVANTPPYRADWKPIVERRFGLTNERIIHWLPAAVRRTVRGDKDYRLESALTLAELRKILALCFIEHNQFSLIKDYPRDPDMVRMRVRANPLELWHWGIEQRSGALRYFSPEVVRRKLLPNDEATMTPRGLRYKQQYYTCAYIEERDWRAKARQSGTWRMDITYDPWSSAQVWLKLRDHKDLITCDEIPGARASGGVPWAELELEQTLEELYRRREQGPRRQARIQTDVQIEQIVQQAKDRAASLSATESNAQRVRGITQNRQAEKLDERRKNREATADIPPQPTTSGEPRIPLFDEGVSAELDALVDEED